MRERLRVALDKISYVLACLLMVGMVVIVLLQVFYRFVIAKPLSWSEEVARYIFVWAVFVASYIALRKRLHRGITLVIEKLPLQVRRVLQLLSWLGIAVCLLVIVFEGSKLAYINMQQPSPAARIPMGVVYAAVPVGAFLMLIGLLVQL